MTFLEKVNYTKKVTTEKINIILKPKKLFIQEWFSKHYSASYNFKRLTNNTIIKINTWFVPPLVSNKNHPGTVWPYYVISSNNHSIEYGFLIILFDTVIDQGAYSGMAKVKFASTIDNYV